MLNQFSFATKMFWREWRAGEWLIIFFAIFFAVTVTTAMHFYTDRLMRGVENQSAQFLGGNLALISSTPLAAHWKDQAKAMNLKHAEVWSYPSMIKTGEMFKLVNIQAVSSDYPLLTQPIVRPNAHMVWVDPRLVADDAVQLTKKIKIGASEFIVEKKLDNNIDNLNTGWLIAPRVMIRLEDVSATKTVISGSRIEYRLLLVGDKQSLENYRQVIQPSLKSGQRFIDSRTQQLLLQSILNNFDNYLQLILLVCLLMSGVAIAFSIHLYLHRHFSHVALWRCLGAKQNQIMLVIIMQLLWIVCIAGSAGVIVGYLLQNLIASLFQQFLTFPLPPISIRPVFLGFATAAFLLFAFSFPVIYMLPRTSPLYIWRGEVVLPQLRYGIYLAAIMLTLLVFLYLFLGITLLTLFFIDVILLAIGFLYVLNYFILQIIKIVSNHTNGFIKRGLNELVQHPQQVGLQFVGFTLVIMLLIVLFFIRTNLINQWRASLPKSTPNYFVINIAPEDLPALKQVLNKWHVAVEQLYPMVRGRLVALNGKPILSAIPKAALSHNALHRELNLSWMLQYPKNNKVVVGQAWNADDTDKQFVSVENDLAQTLNLKLNDRLTFQIGEQQFSATVANFRTLDWSSFSPNFYMIFTPAVLENLPTTYITSFYLSADQVGLVGHLQEQFPNISVIDVASLLLQIQHLIEKVTVAIQYLFFFALGAGVLIFITSLQAGMSERKETYELIRILGASKKFIILSLLVEFVTLFLIIIFIAYFGAKLISLLLAQRFFPS